MKFGSCPSLKNIKKHDSKLTNLRQNEEGLQYLICYENHVSYSYMGESGSEWLGVARSGTLEIVFNSSIQNFFGKVGRCGACEWRI